MAVNSAYFSSMAAVPYGHADFYFIAEEIADNVVRLSAEETEQYTQLYLGTKLPRAPMLRLNDAGGLSRWAEEQDFTDSARNWGLLHPRARRLVRMVYWGEDEEMEEYIEDPTEDQEVEYEDGPGDESDNEEDTPAAPVQMSEKKRGKQPLTGPTPAPATAAPSLFSTTSLSASNPSLPAPSHPQSNLPTTIKLNARTPPYIGTTPIPANIQNIRNQILQQTSPTRVWLHSNFPTQFVKRGFFKDRSDFWNFWMDSRLFDGPTWWKLATGTRKPYPKNHNATAQIQPGSEGQVLNRWGNWRRNWIYPAPAPRVEGTEMGSETEDEGDDDEGDDDDSD